MKIEVKNGTAYLSDNSPIFIGATSGLRYLGGIYLSDIAISPQEGDAGTLVFDRADKKSRTPTSPTFFHYWWKDGKLVVKEGLDVNRFYDKARLHPTLGLVWQHLSGMYHTAHLGVSLGFPTKQVEIIDLLRFLEGKMSLQALDDKVIEK